MKPIPAGTRFWMKVRISAVPNACWEWTASTHGKGYGQFQAGGVGAPKIDAHRMAEHFRI